MSSVLVLGAGVIGAAIAEELSHRGARVQVLDMRAPGRGASQASAGILAPFIESHGSPTLLALGKRSLEMYDAFVARVADASGLGIQYSRCGTVEVALHEDDAARLRAAKAMLDAAGIASEWMDLAALASMEPAVTRSAVGGLFSPVHAFVAASELVAALISSARFAGAVCEGGVEAAEVVPTDRGVTVRAGTRTYEADHAVIAAGSWSSRIRVKGVTPPPVRPIRGQLLHLAWPDARSLPRRVVWGPDCYTLPWSDGSLLVGATAEDVGFDERSTVEGVRGLMTAVEALLPQASQASVEGVRVGLRPATPDHLPAIGPFARAPRVVVATGHFRNGVLLAPVTAALVSDLVVNGVTDPALASTSPDRFTSPA